MLPFLLRAIQQGERYDESRINETTRRIQLE